MSHPGALPQTPAGGEVAAPAGGEVAAPAGGEVAARPFTDILCAVDGTRRSLAAVEQAAALAGPDGHLTLLAVTAVTGSGAYRNAAISPSRVDHILERAVALCEQRGVRCATTVENEGPVPRAILAHAAAHDLLALGAPSGSWLGERTIEGVGLGSLSALQRPLLAARAQLPGAPAFPQRMVVASDGLDGSEEVVELAARLALAHHAELVLVHAAGIESHARPHRIAEQSRRLEGVLGDAAHARVEVGDAAEAIVHAGAELRASLLVLGSRRPQGLAAIGSVSRRVVHAADCSVLLAPPRRGGEQG